ncbi:MAG: hypothetical protein ACI4C2_05660 [Lachnospiraceae bacterium]
MKGNSLKDEIKISRMEGLQGKSNWYKFKYYVYYYKIPVIVGIGVLVFLISLVHSIVTAKDTVLSVALLNANQEVDYSLFLDEYFQTTDYDAGKTEMRIDASYCFYDNYSNYQNEQRFFVATAAEQIDVVIGSKEIFEKYADMGYFIDLSKLMDADTYSKYSDMAHTTSLTEEYGGNTEVSGLDITNWDCISKLKWYEGSDEPVYIGIVCESKNKEQAIDFINYLSGY